MKRKNATRSALFTSIISLLLCVSMLVGTTFAWFTDSVVSGNNLIAAGNLDIELYNDGNKVTSSTNLFNGITWEPGVVDYENFTIKNEGNLALLYDFAINWGDYNTLAGQYNLTQVLKVAMVDKHVSGDRAAAIAAGENVGWKSLNEWSFKGEMTTQGETKDFALIIYWEPSDNDNNWNVQNGKTLDKGDHLYINLGISLQATQKMYESDSFGPDYDALANPWDGTAGVVPEPDENGVITLTTGAELAAFAASVNSGTTYSGKTVQLGADINLANQPWTAIGDCESGKYFQGTFDGQGHTIYNLSVDYSNDPSEHATAGLFGWVDYAMATVKNVNLENATVLGSHWVGGIAGYFTGRIENCSVRNSTIMGFNVNDDANGDKVGGIVGCLNEHSYINNNSVSGTEITANRDVGGIAGSVAEYTYEMKNNKVTDTTICYSVEKDYASAGKIISGRTGYVADETNTDNNVTITRVINVKTVAELNKALAELSGDALNTAALLQNCNEPNGVVEIPAAYTGTLTLKDSSIASVNAANAANIVIAGDVKVDASTCADGTSAITGVTLNISGNGNLTAIGNGKHGYGIGGDQTTNITIENVHIVDVKGGYVQPAVTGNWGKVNEEGGAAIGSGANGAVITLNSVTIDNAQGGGKAAGIGAKFWTGVTVNINNSTIKNVEGGATAAGIGGSRVSNGATTAESVTVNIVNSNVTAIGGDYGAGIGSGYSAYLRGESADRPLYTINIDVNSVINATGGVAAAGIGTGHNVVGLTGEIKSQNVTAKAGSATCPAPNVECCGARVRTDAQDIGFGSLADEIFEAPITKTITYLGNEIQIPALPIASSEDLDEAIKEGKTVLTLAAGTYTIPESAKGKTLTINGTKDVIIQVRDQSGSAYANPSDGTGVDYGFDGSTVTFNGVTIDTTAQSGQYRGFARLSAVYNDCAFKGTYTLGTGTSEFNNCTFDLQNNYVWTWGASKVTFNKCTFEDSQGYAKAILVHNTVATEITVKDCTFIATTAAKTWDQIPVAAVSIDPNAKQNVSIAFEGTNTYSDVFNGLYQLKYAPEAYLLSATVEGETVTVPAMKETHP